MQIEIAALVFGLEIRGGLPSEPNKSPFSLSFLVDRDFLPLSNVRVGSLPDHALLHLTYNVPTSRPA